MIERRTSTRIRKQSRITWRSEEFQVDGITHDICPGGVFIITNHSFPPKSVIEVELWISDEEPLVRTLGEVVWINHGQLDCYPPGFGVKFIGMDEESSDRLLSLCEGTEF